MATQRATADEGRSGSAGDGLYGTFICSAASRALGATIVVDRRHGEIAEGESEVDIRIVEGGAPVAEKVTVPAEPPDEAEAQTEE